MREAGENDRGGRFMRGCMRGAPDSLPPSLKILHHVATAYGMPPPSLHPSSGAEAVSAVRALQALLRAVGAADANMEVGAPPPTPACGLLFTRVPLDDDE